MNKVLFIFAFWSVFFFITLFPNEFNNACSYQIKNPSTFQQYAKDLSPICHREWLLCSLQFSSRIFFLLDTVYDRIMHYKDVQSYSVGLFLHFVLKINTLSFCTLICMWVRLHSINYVFLKIKRQGTMNKESKISVFSFRDWEESSSPFSTHRGTWCHLAHLRVFIDWGLAVAWAKRINNKQQAALLHEVLSKHHEVLSMCVHSCRTLK